MVTGAALGVFMLGEDFAGALDDRQRKPGELGDFNAVALVGRAALNFAKKDNAA